MAYVSIIKLTLSVHAMQDSYERIAQNANDLSEEKWARQSYRATNKSEFYLLINTD